MIFTLVTSVSLERGETRMDGSGRRLALILFQRAFAYSFCMVFLTEFVCSTHRLR